MTSELHAPNVSNFVARVFNIDTQFMRLVRHQREACFERRSKENCAVGSFKTAGPRNSVSLPSDCDDSIEPLQTFAVQIDLLAIKNTPRVKDEKPVLNKCSIIRE